MRAAHAGPALALAMALVTAAGAAAEPLGVPVLDSAGVRWTAPARPAPEDVVRWRAAMPPDSADLPTKRAAWRALSMHPTLGSFALRRLALVQRDLGDSAGADSTRVRLAAARGPWSWEAVRSRAEARLAGGRAAAADSLLAAEDREGWPDADRAAWLQLRVEARLAAGDTAQALTFARQALQRYPSLPATARGLATLDSVLARRGARLEPEDARAAAEVEAWRNRPAAGAARLAAVLPGLTGEARSRVALRRAELLRAARRLDDARAALADAARDAGADDRARVALERGRIERDAGRHDRAAAAFAEAARTSADTTLREAAWWDRARVAESRARWAEAGADYDRVTALGGRRRADSAFRSGLMAIARGDVATARRRLDDLPDDGARFWSAVLRRRTDRPGGDEALRALAGRPGYSFYRAAARETLGVRGWPALRVAVAAESSSGALATAGALLAAGLDSDAITLVDRWAAGDPRLGSVPDRGSAPALLDAARLAYAAGRVALGIRLSARAQEMASDDAWAVAPWLHPPALDTLFAAGADSAGGPEPALLRAIAWQESKFDPAARSRSDALGLLQLKLATAREVAARRREPAPGPEDLLDPARNLRLGRDYVARQLARFGGNVPLALAAYNAGPGAVARWRTVQRAAGGHVGGDALDVELIASPETEDYVKRILAVRQAYRELRPGLGRR